MLSNFQTMHSVLLPTTHTVERSYLYLAICRIDSIDLVVHGRYSTLHNWHGNDSPPLASCSCSRDECYVAVRMRWRASSAANVTPPIGRTRGAGPHTRGRREHVRIATRTHSTPARP